MRWMYAVVLGVIGAVQVGCSRGGDPPGEPTVVYLVRHAERADDGTADPPLSEEGLGRAALLDRMLADANLTALYSTDLARTRQTAAPLAERFGLETTLYGPRELEDLAGRLAAMPGARVLVAGHSNTTPMLVELLGGDPVSDIDEAEYDRLYLVILHPAGVATSVLLRFGAPFVTP